MEKKKISILPGLVLCLLLALPSWFLGKAFPLIGGPVIGILIGIILANVFPKFIKGEKNNFLEGINFTSKKMLQLSIILLGFEMNLFNVIEVGSKSLAVMVFTLLGAFLTAYFVGRLLKVDRDTGILVGVGTAICGGSAIAATAPVIKAKDEDVVSSISTIFLFNIIAVLIFPFLGHLLGMGDSSFGIWAGTAINDTSSVVAAGTAWSVNAGNNVALNMATIVKLTRTLMIVPITLVLAIYTSRREKKNDTGNFSFSKVFPWFVIFFILAAVINTFYLFQLIFLVG